MDIEQWCNMDGLTVLICDYCVYFLWTSPFRFVLKVKFVIRAGAGRRRDPGSTWDQLVNTCSLVCLSFVLDLFTLLLHCFYLFYIVLQSALALSWTFLPFYIVFLLIILFDGKTHFSICHLTCFWIHIFFLLCAINYKLTKVPREIRHCALHN